MKKVLFATVSALAVGVAIAADSTQFGVMKVPSSAKETIVSVPWMESTTSVSDVTVSNLVLTSGLEVGDKLMYYNGSGYVSWVITEVSGIKVWTSGNVVQKNIKTDEDEVVATGASSDVTIPRGGAVILKRDNPGDSFCIMGKPSSDSATTKLGAGYSLVAPPAVVEAGTKVNDMTWNGVVTGDTLLVPTNGSSFVTLYWKNADVKWRWWDDSTKKWVVDATIPMGTGAWFVNSGTTEKSVTWAATK